MQYWLLKTEPTEYNAADLARDGTARWDGITNPAALQNLRAMRPGDECVVYHTGNERAAVALARVAQASDAEPGVVDVAFARDLPKPVTLAAMRADRAFTDSDLLRLGRLSVVPLPEAVWRRLLELAGA